MVDYYCHVLPHLPVCIQTSLVCWDPASESVYFYHLSPESSAHTCRFLTGAYINRPWVGHSWAVRSCSPFT